MPTRRYAVTVPAAELARLRAFDNATEGRKHWPIGPNRSFMRRNATTFVVKEWASMGIGKAAVMTLGRATLGQGHDVEVMVKTKNAWIGYLVIVCGLACLAMTPRDGLWAAVLGIAMVLGGWFLFVRGSDRQADLDAVETVLRQEIRGDWQPVG